jgi:xanthine dehydrogenase accessory factor
MGSLPVCATPANREVKISNTAAILILVRGGGDLASGVALRLQRAGLRLAITELPQPLVVRRTVAFASAVYDGSVIIEGVAGRRVDQDKQIWQVINAGEIPVLVDPRAEARTALCPQVIVDARLTKQPPDLGMKAAELVIGLGPGFTAGQDCHAVVETQRGHRLGRVIWQGSAASDSGIPEGVAGYSGQRVLRAPRDGILRGLAQIGDLVEAGQPLAEIEGETVSAPFQGVLRGLIHPGLRVWRGLKIGDVDPRSDPQMCWQVSDKSLAVGGGVLEAILSIPALRLRLWDIRAG